MTFITSLPENGVIYVPSTEPFDFIAYLLANGWWKGNGNDYHKAGEVGGSLLITEDNQIVVNKVEYDMPATRAEADALLYLLGYADRPAILDLVPYTPPPPVRKTADEKLRICAMRYIQLRNLLACINDCATQFTIEMEMKQANKQKYNALIQYVRNFSASMLPTNTPKEDKEQIRRFSADYSAILYQMAAFMAVLDSGSVDTFIDDLDALFAKYTTDAE